MERNIIENKLGYYEVKEKPSKKSLNEYYANRYYQNNHSTYSEKYSEAEIKYRESKFSQKKYILEQELNLTLNGKNFLDIGCGEGFSLEFFSNLEMNVTGIDYSKYGLQSQNERFSNNVIEGDLFEVLLELKEKKSTFDLILLDNVLEHVIDPQELLQLIRSIMGRHSILMIEVPNDFSILQNKLIKEESVSRPYWITVPDHLNYFTKKSLLEVCKVNGIKELVTLADYPIDLNLLFQESNYIENSHKGQMIHEQRMCIENYFTQLSIRNTTNILKEIAEMGLGRNILSYLKRVDLDE